MLNEFYDTQDLMNICNIKDITKMSRIINEVKKTGLVTVKKDIKDKRVKLYDRNSAISIITRATDFKRRDIERYKDLNILARFKSENEIYNELKDLVNKMNINENETSKFLKLLNSLKSKTDRYYDEINQIYLEEHNAKLTYEDWEEQHLEEMKELKEENRLLIETNLELIKKLK